MCTVFPVVSLSRFMLPKADPASALNPLPTQPHYRHSPELSQGSWMDWSDSLLGQAEVHLEVFQVVGIHLFSSCTSGQVAQAPTLPPAKS